MARYRADIALDVLGAFVTAAVLCLFWSAVFRNRPDVAGLDLTYMVRYVLLTRAILVMTRPSGVAREMSDRVRDGSLIVELVRPYGLLGYIVARCLSGILWQTLWIAPPLLGAALLLNPVLPAASRLAGFVATLAFAIVYNTAVEVLLALSAFWLKRNEGLIHARDFLTSLLSGALVPLALFPASLRNVLSWLPFRATVDAPVQWLLGDAALRSFVHPAVWGVLLWAVCALMVGHVTRRFDALGG